MNKFNRRDFIGYASIIIALSFAQKVGVIKSASATTLFPQDSIRVGKTHGQNFKAIYSDEKLRDKFYGFLANVYSVYPSVEFHQLILKATQAHENDIEIYAEIQRRLPDITPFMALLRYSLPSLRHQKREMSRQTGILLSGMKAARNYLEIGTPGTYVRGVKDHVDLTGEIYLMDVESPKYSPSHIAQRGQISKGGHFVPMNDYAPIDPKVISPGSVELISNYIGFHHAGSKARMPFIKSVSRLLPSGGKLILRDHDVRNDTMAHVVALAHDVFNAGLMVEWKINEKEVRNFTTIEQLEEELFSVGLTRKGTYMLQKGDPTLNTLMVFEKA